MSLIHVSQWRMSALALVSSCMFASHVAHAATSTFDGEQLGNHQMGLWLDFNQASGTKGRMFLAATDTKTELSDGASGELQRYRPSSSNSTLFPNFIFLPLTSVTIDQQDGRILQEKFAGTISLFNESDDLTDTGGNLSISNITLDFVERKLRADLDSDNGIDSGQGYWLDAATSFPLFDVSALNGTTNAQHLLSAPGTVYCLPGELCAPGYSFGPGSPTHLDASGLNIQLDTLSVSQQGEAAMSSSLGLIETGQSALAIASANFAVGAVRAVPEPSSFLLMGLGLAGLVAARRRLG